MKYKKYYYYTGDPQVKSSIQHCLIQEFKTWHIGLYLYDACGWTNLPWENLGFIMKFGQESCGKLIHWEFIFFRWMIRVCVMKQQ